MMLSHARQQQDHTDVTPKEAPGDPRQPRHPRLTEAGSVAGVCQGRAQLPDNQMSAAVPPQCRLITQPR